MGFLDWLAKTAEESKVRQERSREESKVRQERSRETLRLVKEFGAAKKEWEEKHPSGSTDEFIETWEAWLEQHSSDGITWQEYNSQGGTMTQRNPKDEISEIAGAVIAHETFLIHLAKMMVVSGITTDTMLHNLIHQLIQGEKISDPTIRAGYHDALEKIREGLVNIH